MASAEPVLRRVVVPAGDLSAPAAQMTPYELERAARVARNTATMAALGVTKAAAALSAPAVWRRAKPGGAGGERRAKRPAEAAPEPPARVSKRIRVRAGLAEPEPDGSASEPDAGLEAEEDRPRMLSVDEYLERKGLPKGTHPPNATPVHQLRLRPISRALCGPGRPGASRGCLPNGLHAARPAGGRERRAEVLPPQVR